jgi:HD superfamily phosphohydrolase
LSHDAVYKSIRCPLYGFIDLTKIETKVLDTSAMQRLSRIKQLSHSYIVYPSAVHTRFEHSIGTLWVAGKICDALKLPQEQTQIIRLAALLHDVGQGPFSHIWEEPMRWVNGESFSHEDVTRKIIQSDPEISETLGEYKKEVLEVFTDDSLNSDIISSSLDADKLDYLRRDSYHTGVSYGRFDIDRVIHTVCKLSEENRDYLAVHEKGGDALENYRLARYAMHTQVYEHHTRLIADDMFLKAIKFAFADGCIKKENLSVSSNTFIQDFLKLDDHSVQHQILQGGGIQSKDLILRIRNRRLLKRALEVPITEIGIPDAIKRRRTMQMDKKQTDEIEIKIANELGIDPAYIVVHLQSIKIKLYERFSEIIEEKQKPIYVKKKNGPPSSFDEETPFSTSLKQINRLYVFCPEEYIEKTRNVATNKLGL